MKILLMLLMPLQMLAQQFPIILKNVYIVEVRQGALLSRRHVLIEGERIKRKSSKPLAVQSAQGSYILFKNVNVVDVEKGIVLPTQCFN